MSCGSKRVKRIGTGTRFNFGATEALRVLSIASMAIQAGKRLIMKG
jgi:hypothetical protein